MNQFMFGYIYVITDFWIEYCLDSRDGKNGL